MPRGGHFAAFEQPELLVDDVREFFRPLRIPPEGSWIALALARHGARSVCDYVLAAESGGQLGSVWQDGAAESGGSGHRQY